MTQQAPADAYALFLRAKAHLDGEFGFEPVWMPDVLFPFQAAMVDWALREGRAALFEDCGLGKGLQELVWSENVVRKTNGNVLIKAPLAVAGQLAREAEKFGIEAHYSRDGKVKRGINITNYERLHLFDPEAFTGTANDESSILKNFDGARRGQITEFDRRLPYQRSEDITIGEATQRLLAELLRMGVGEDDVVISSNLQLRLDGLPRSGQAQPADPGVAVYWRDGKQDRCMAIDLYTKVEQNIAALAATIDAMRAIERHGGAAILDRAFTGFTALPAPIVAGMARPWWEVLGVPRDCTREQAKDAYRRLAGAAHPDKGGTHERMAELNSAQEAALQECTQ